MRFFILCISLVINISGLTQNIDTKGISNPDTLKLVKFTVRFHLSTLDKDDAAVLKGYVVNIGYDRAKSLDGKKIRITGYVSVIYSSLERQPGMPIPQGRQGPYKFIESPIIEIIK